MSSNADNSGKKCPSSDISAKEGSSSDKLAKKMEPATIPSDIKRGPSADTPSLRLTMSATVVKGFGRGSKLLGIPTANMAMKEIGERVNDTQTGIYFGYTMLRGVVYQAVVSIGWNPYFDNREKTVEPHLLHKFDEDFYGEKLHLLLCGFIRNELNFKSLYDLIEAIGDDIKYARKKFEEPEVASLAVDDPFWAEVVALENATPPEGDTNPSDADDIPPAASASASTSSTATANSSSSTSDSTAATSTGCTEETVEKSTTEATSTDATRDVSGGSGGKTDESTDGGNASTGNGKAG